MKTEEYKVRRARTHSGLDSGVRLDISSDVGTKKRKTDLKSLLSTIKHQKREEEGEVEGADCGVSHPTFQADQLISKIPSGRKLG